MGGRVSPDPFLKEQDADADTYGKIHVVQQNGNGQLCV